MENTKSLITITFCDRAENHAGMQVIGSEAGCVYTYDKLNTMSQEISNSEFVDLSLGDIKTAVLIIRNFYPRNKKLLKELRSLEWDTKAYMRGRVVNKKARYNLCFSNFDQEPDYENKKGTIVDFSHLKHLNKVRNAIMENLEPECELVAEGNMYYDMNKCYIGYHGDSERNVVIGLRLGCTYNLTYCWHQNRDKVGEEIDISLNSGDLYIMSDKAVGKDWKKRLIPTLRHSVNPHLAK